VRFLITGAAGFIGSHLTDRLLASGHSVVGVDDLSTGRRDNFAGDLYVVDIARRRDLYAVANACEPDVVVHCAASYSDPNLWHRDTDTNVTGTINATLVARHHGARLVYFQTALPPISSYAISKIAGEQYIALSRVPALVFRLANIYGPRNFSGPIPTFYKRLAAGEPCTVTETLRDTVFIDDLIDLVAQAVDGDVTGKFDVCSGDAYPILRYYNAVARALGVDTEPNLIPRPSDDVEQMELSQFRARVQFGWKPKVGLEDGISRTVAWYRDHGVVETYTHLQLGKAA
jgi:UDP-glucose 4-epimerase